MERENVPGALPEQQGRALLEGVVLPSALAGAVRQDQPVVVFVAGQAGSGKTAVVDLVHGALAARGGAVRVDRDTYKNIHPHYPALLAEDVRTAGIRVRTDTYGWQSEVEERVWLSRFDAVVEAALGRPDEFLAEIAVYRRAGYRVEIVALAVPEALSQLGVLDRYLRLAVEGRARYVGWDNQAACAAALPAALAAVEDGRLADRVLVVRRSATMVAEAVYGNELGPDGWVRPARAARAVLAERGRPWGAAETGRFRRELAGCERRVHDPRIPQDWALATGRDAERAAALAEPVRRTAQPLPTAPGVDYHRLSRDEHDVVFDAVIVPSMLEPITTQESPTVVYIAGQPGAGKTAAARLVHRSLRRPVHLSGDDFKTLHPDYLELLRTDPRRASEKIRADYRAWQARAEAYVRERRGNVVVETTPSGPAAFAKAASAYRRAGYRVELVVLAVRAADSRQGTAHRYTRLTRLGVPARFTTAAGHDAHFDVLADVVATAEENAVVDQVTVMRRDATALYRSSPTRRRPEHPAAALALLAEQARPYTDQEAAVFWTVQRELHAAMPQYRDDLTTIGTLAVPLMPAARRPRLLPSPGGEAALPLARRGS
ncbi:Zeta toxin family protein [Kitasatospora sp. MMS16-BH015]|uniref:zeta toxin family protein n=1 Tax=Kitasatospora sp. MMS16-BH015 TaxID=2018025 RepID=UPI000CA3AB15|nr:zeta toxin family protein [Kitasatospora sp. MMS16-BH015]AUG76858.1 Zeta toxin family protein [Kitasatospora sp. MMS16-BH015]